MRKLDPCLSLCLNPENLSDVAIRSVHLPDLSLMTFITNCYGTESLSRSWFIRWW